MSTTTAYTAPRFAIVNDSSHIADDLGSSPIFATEAEAEEAIESLANALGEDFDADDYSVRELTTDDLAGDERTAMLAAVREFAAETAEQELAECGSLAAWGDVPAASWDALDAMLVGRFGCVRAPGRLGADVTAAYREGRESADGAAGTTEADAARTITVAIDSDCRLGSTPLIWGAAEGDDTDAALANARECIAEGGELSPASVKRRAEGLDVVSIEWAGALPNGDNAAAIALALAALAA